MIHPDYIGCRITEEHDEMCLTISTKDTNEIFKRTFTDDDFTNNKIINTAHIFHRVLDDGLHTDDDYMHKRARVGAGVVRIRFFHEAKNSAIRISIDVNLRYISEGIDVLLYRADSSAPSKRVANVTREKVDQIVKQSDFEIEYIESKIIKLNDRLAQLKNEVGTNHQKIVDCSQVYKH